MSRQNITAIIYDKRGRVLSIGKNSYVKTHPYQARLAAKAGMAFKKTLHAEIDAIIKCKNIDKAYKIFVSRSNVAGIFRNAKPCQICSTAIASTPIKIIEHT